MKYPLVPGLLLYFNDNVKIDFLIFKRGDIITYLQENGDFEFWFKEKIVRLYRPNFWQLVEEEVISLLPVEKD